MTAPANEQLNGLLQRLPAHFLRQDADSGGMLQALLSAVGAELGVLEHDLDDLYDAWFVETCAEWVLPYIAELIGIADLPADFGPGTSRRSLVANTVAYRRRKGTVAALEQVARDVTGWPARAVEFYRVLAATTHLNHVRLDRPAIASVREALDLTALDHAGAPGFTPGLDPVAHTAEVRRISSRRGRYGIPQVGIFLYPLRIYEADWSPARVNGSQFTVDPLGHDVPLFSVPTPEVDLEHLADEPDLPVPLRPRRLLGLLRAARAGQLDPARLPVGVRIGTDGIPLAPSRIRVCGLEDPDPATPSGQWQAMVDPLRGRITCYDGVTPSAPESVLVRYAYGGFADVGAGTYDRADVHDAALSSDRYSGRMQPEAQVAVRAGVPPSAREVGSVADALAAAATYWAGPNGVGGTYVISIGDSASYPEPLEVTIPPGTRLVIVAATWPTRVLPSGEVRQPEPGQYSPNGLRPLLSGLKVTGGSGSSLVLDGVVLDGSLVITAGDLGALAVAQSTLAGAILVDAEPGAANADLHMRVLRSIVADVEFIAPVPEIGVTESVVTGAVTGASVHATFDGSTVFDRVAVRSLDGSNCVFDSPVTVEHCQIGCLRFCCTAAGSRTPRRFRCAPDGRAPVFASRNPGSPAFAALASGCPPEIRMGAEHGNEMGVHYHLRRQARAIAAQRALATYLPVQIEFGIFGS